MAAGWIAAAVLFCIPAAAAPSHSARSAVVLDAATGRVLYACRPDDRSLIASTTKIMTGLLVAEQCNPADRVSVPKEAVGTEGSSLYLKEGEVLTVQTLLYGLMLHSGNDAAVTLAIYCAGSVPAFVEQMNRKAQELGLTNTHFSNPHGLDAENHYSTARDLARLAAYAMDNALLRQVTSARSANLEGRSFTNHNKLLWRYAGTVGVKTGYTRNAGRILVSAAERDGRRLIAVTIHDPDDWQDHVRLLDYGFSAFTPRTVFAGGQILGSVPVIGGAEDQADVVPLENLEYPLAEQERTVLRLNLPEFVYAPVLAGSRAGTVSVLVDGVELTSVPVYWRYSVWEEA